MIAKFDIATATHINLATTALQANLAKYILLDDMGVRIYIKELYKNRDDYFESFFCPSADINV